MKLLKILSIMLLAVIWTIQMCIRDSYSVLGLEKRHLFSMILKETMIMGFVTLLLGIGVGLSLIHI